MTPRDPEVDVVMPQGPPFPVGATSEVASPAMRAFVRVLSEAARHTAPVLLTGEPGTGKTTFARVLHAMSPRAARPFVTVDGPTADRDLSADVAWARGGTIFLDEVTELSLPAQAWALTLFEGSAGPPDVRVVASSGRNLEAEIAAGRLRRDLFYRLSILEIRVPALRERLEDLIPMARRLAAAAAFRAGRSAPPLTPALERALLVYAWPGNVGELMGALERAIILDGDTSLDIDDLPPRIRAATTVDPAERT